MDLDVYIYSTRVHILNFPRPLPRSIHATPNAIPPQSTFLFLLPFLRACQVADSVKCQHFHLPLPFPPGPYGITSLWGPCNAAVSLVTGPQFAAKIHFSIFRRRFVAPAALLSLLGLRRISRPQPLFPPQLFPQRLACPGPGSAGSADVPKTGRRGNRMLRMSSDGWHAYMLFW